jgi:AmmeMemoRadiSam system protein B
MPPISDLRPSPIAGSWYTKDPVKLSQQIDDYLADAKLPTLKGEVVAIIAPHAGHIYSGGTAGFAFRAVQGKSYELVAVLSPFHNFHFSPLLTTAHKAYSTPLGNIEVDQRAISQLNSILETSSLSITPIACDGEHSLEIELPFLQRAIKKDFKLLPLMLRSHDMGHVKAIGLALAEVLNGHSSLMVASSDLSHFYPTSQAEVLDAEVLKQIGNFSPEGLFKADKEGTGFACGLPAIAAVLWAAKALGADHAQVLHHSTSADQTGDTSSVVGYGAAVILKTS